MPPQQQQQQQQSQNTTLIPPQLRDATRRIDLDRFERLQEEQMRRMQSEEQRNLRHKRLMKTSALYRLGNKIGDRMVLRNRMGREAFKMALYLTIPVVGTLLLMQPQFSEYVILNHTPYVEREESHENAFRLSKILMSSKRDYRQTDDLFFRMQDEKEQQVKRHLEYLKQQGQQGQHPDSNLQSLYDSEKRESTFGTVHSDGDHDDSGIVGDEGDESLKERIWNKVDMVFDKVLPLRNMATEELMRSGTPEGLEKAGNPHCDDCARDREAAIVRKQLAERVSHESTHSRFSRVLASAKKQQEQEQEQQSEGATV